MSEPPTPARNILLLVHELHKGGYQRFRIFPGMSPSGLHWRCAIAPVIKPDRWAGMHLPAGADAVYYSSSQEKNYFDWADAAEDDPAGLAQKFCDRFPQLVKQAHGTDWAYAGWYMEMLHLTEPNGLPIIYADWDLPSDYLAVVGIDHEIFIPLPPIK